MIEINWRFTHSTQILKKKSTSWFWDIMNPLKLDWGENDEENNKKLKRINDRVIC